MSTQSDNTIFDSEVGDHLDDTVRAGVRPVLIMLDGPDAHQQRVPVEKSELRLGRDIGGEIVLRDNRASRNHARLLYRNIACPDQDPEIVLLDNNSTNGTFVNGERVRGERRLRDRDKILIGSTLMGFFIRDETEMQADERLYTLARLDALTTLLNRGSFNSEFQREFERALRYGRPLSLVMFDVDHFKRFNDTYGHQAGDYVLQELGRLIKSHTRGNDIAARYGGEEFAIILPETHLEGAVSQAERLRGAIQRHPFQYQGVSFALTVSLGLAEVEPETLLAEDLLKAADKALYQAKAEGRNRVCWMRLGSIRSGTVQ